MKGFLADMLYAVLFLAVIAIIGWGLLSEVSARWTPDPAMSTEQYSSLVRGEK
jgi:hypothetical protein